MNKKIHKLLQSVMVVFGFKRNIGDNEGFKFTEDGDFVDLKGNVCSKDTHDAYIPYAKAVSLMWQVRNESFEDGVNWQKNQQPMLKQLVFDDGYAETPICCYDINVEYDDTYSVTIESPLEDDEYFNSKQEAIDFCNNHYRELIESCWSSES